VNQVANGRDDGYPAEEEWKRDPAYTPVALRSHAWFGAPGKLGSHHRSKLYSEGLRESAFDGRPVIGICNTASELNPCNLHNTRLAESVRRGVLQAGGTPFVFPTISIGEPLARPTAMILRNLMAMDVEEMIRTHPLDAVVLLGGCDKTTPALVMGAVSADIPCIVVTSGPMVAGCFRGREVGAGTDLWKVAEEVRSGQRPPSDLHELERAQSRSYGHCNTMGTASTMACMVELLGLSLPGAAALGSVEAGRLALAEESGSRAVELALEDLRPSRILDGSSFRNAITGLAALSGSTNAIIHLLAIAGRAEVELSLEDFDTTSRSVPVLVDVKPAGEYLMQEMADAGGVPALVTRLSPLLDLNARTVTGKSLGDNCASAQVWNPRVIRTLDDPVAPAGSGLRVLRGNLAPDGAVIKPAAATAELGESRSRARVFDAIEDYLRAADDPDADFEPTDAIIVRGAGPVGYPGMPEIGNLPIPRSCLAQGVRDMVRITDARMSGTAFGTVVLHVSPEASVGGPLAAVRDGDPIELSLKAGVIRVDLPPQEWQARLDDLSPAAVPGGALGGGYTGLYRRTVQQAPRGADLDFLVGRRPCKIPRRSA